MQIVIFSPGKAACFNAKALLWELFSTCFAKHIQVFLHVIAIAGFQQEITPARPFRRCEKQAHHQNTLFPIIQVGFA